ncbi:anaerobic dimethyl sulfoxide reductase subunit B (iron-sulfur subunit) [Trueperella bonasi]|uniref:Anaerobic dimethyl sulfoxide reductase subunit B (Iron-sulfur subunit) n=1 Tax=Trueperella bonasi TaxID=312286 RepID=A0ABT9NGK3_9ACTO|nr:DMSO/selenate family reductase complex B subunit [Trueperella bonasi]MDP9806531.1 anaerobic dimethyl sulfoxide reductase subunit B (iron-sulfur subunit) [Trueperella bonasi]
MGIMTQRDPADYVLPNGKYGFFFDQELCTGCKACQIACKDKHDLPIGVNWRRVVEYAGGATTTTTGDAFTTSVFAYYTSIACNHCEDAICMTVCPTTAMSRREDGTIYVDPGKCVGCRYCEWACSYGAPQFNPDDGQMTKCDLCYDYRETGQEPACVTSCPSRALDWGPIEDLRAEYGTEAGVAPLPDPTVLNPRLVIKPHKDAQPWDSANGEILNPMEI